MDILSAISIAIGCLVIGGALGFVLFRYVIKQKYNQIIKEAKIEAEALKEKKQLELKEKFLNRKAELDKEA
ncbi:MAG: ribonuclease Y, partial [Bacteroidaceae bacterium]|nr:ribonuclease Y [Bacteroidaceae bacterium]